MALFGKGLLAIWNGIAPEAEQEFVAWHVREHIPERVSVPGFLRGRRYVAVQGGPKYFNFYETETVETLTSTDYQARLMAPSDWTRQVVAHFTDTSRTLCEVVGTYGQGAGAFIAAMQLSLADAAGFVPAITQAAPVLLQQPGICGIHLLRGQPPVQTAQMTEEVRLRGGRPDATVEWILLAEAVDLGNLHALRGAVLSDAALRGMGAGEIKSGDYALQFMLSRQELGQ